MKIRRNTYEFACENQLFRVIFNHQHMPEVEPPIEKRDKIGVMVKAEMSDANELSVRYYRPLRVGTIKAQHITTCLFGPAAQVAGDNGAMSATVGVATCSVRDEYSRLEGMKKAFERCLLAHGVEFTYEKDAKGKRQIKFPSSYHRERYGKFMKAFFAALRPNGAQGEVTKAAA
jgi:hypothetical protein